MRIPLAANEAERLVALRRLEILDSPPEEAFDRIVRLAAATVGTPIALISLVDESRQWFKARLGIDTIETPREIAFCAHAILDDEPLVVEDATRDPRFADSPLVTGEPFVRFYAGAPIRTRDGHRIGVLCTIDKAPRPLAAEQRQALTQLAAVAGDQLELRRSAMELARRDELLTCTGRMARIGGWQLDLASMTTQWSDEVYRIHEVEPGQRYALDRALDFYPPEARAALEPALARLMAEGIAYDLELPFVTGNGRRIWVRTLGEAEREGGRIVRLSGTFQDVTERRQAEDALRHSEERLRAAQEAAGLGILDVDLANDCARWDARVWAFLGIPPDRAITREGFLEAVHPEDRAKVDASIERAFDPRGTGEHRIEYRVARPNCPGERWLEVTSRALFAGGRPVRLLGTLSDVTVRKRAEVALRETGRRLDALAASGIVGVTVSQGDRIVEANDEFLRMVGYSREDVALGRMAWPRMTPPEWAERSRQAVEESLGTGACRPFEKEYFRKDGSRVPILLSMVMLDAASRRWMCLVQDIGERKRLDEALRESQERLALATASARIGIWDWDIAANKLIWDARMYELYGIREQDFSGAYDAWQAGLHPDDRERGDAAITATLNGVRDFDIEFRVVWPDGQIRDIEAHALVQRGAGGRAVRMIGVNRDITERKRAMETIRFQADQYTTMMNTTADGFWILDRAGMFLAANEAYCRMIGYSREELLSLGIKDIEGVESAESAARHMAHIVEAGFDRFESQHRRKDGVLLDIEGSVSFWREAGQFLCFARDITPRKRAEQALADSEVRLKAVLETNVDGIVMLDLETKHFTFANRAFCDLLGYIHDDLMSIGIDAIHPPGAMPDIESYITRVLQGTARMASDVPTIRKDGSIFFADVSASPVTLDGRIYLVGCFHDVTGRKLAEEQVALLARRDSLTGLVNRRVFGEALEQMIARVRRDGTSFAVLYLDLDRFKDVNDTLGHDAGDALLREVAARLQGCMRDTDTVARLGGDEFAAILPGVAAADDVAGAAERILAALAAPVAYGDTHLYTAASIGITIAPDDGEEPGQLLKNADIALYRAKAERRGSYCFFMSAMRTQVERHKEIEDELRRALDRDEIVPFFQPKIRLEDGLLLGFEALARWLHPEQGVVPPGDFLPVAEETGLILQLGERMLRQSLLQLRRWRQLGLEPGFVAVNLAGAQLRRGGLATLVEGLLAELGLAPDRLAVEITESVFLGRGADRVGEELDGLHALGIEVALDDFGTGYASLTHLKRFPISTLKIDKSFVRDMLQDPGDAAIVRAVVNLGHSLGMQVVGEGIESAAQADWLRLHGCDRGQGYWFGEPMAAGCVTSWLRARPAAGLGHDPIRLRASASGAKSLALDIA